VKKVNAIFTNTYPKDSEESAVSTPEGRARTGKLRARRPERSHALSNAKNRARAEGDVAWIGREIRSLRKVRGMGLEELSRLTDKSVGHLSQIERGLSHPSITALQAISSALGVQIGWFFPHGEAGDPSDRGVVVRGTTRRQLSFDSGVTDYLLSPNLSGALELLLSEFKPGASNGDAPYSHAGEEAGFVLSGTLELWVGDDHFLLAAGDSFSFRSTMLHRYRNPGRDVTRVIWVVTPPSY
jgi:transcriptional regulator with XRE-family HTH domain